MSHTIELELDATYNEVRGHAGIKTVTIARKKGAPIMSAPRPTLDLILHLGSIAHLPREVLADLLAESAAVQSTLTAALVANPEQRLGRE